jgi:hypothetical protein
MDRYKTINREQAPGRQILLFPLTNQESFFFLVTVLEVISLVLEYSHVQSVKYRTIN